MKSPMKENPDWNSEDCTYDHGDSKRCDCNRIPKRFLANRDNLPILTIKAIGW